MKTNHLKENFLEFEGTNILFVKKDGEYLVALKPILKALNLEENRYLKSAKRSFFFGSCLDTVSIQVENNGVKQGRKMTCLPERYIYSWICSLNADNKDLIQYQKDCSDLLFNHFNGAVSGRKDLLIERKKIDNAIDEIKKELKEHDAKYKELKNKEAERKAISTKLNAIDKSITNQYEMEL